MLLYKSVFEYAPSTTSSSSFLQLGFGVAVEFDGMTGGAECVDIRIRAADAPGQIAEVHSIFVMRLER